MLFPYRASPGILKKTHITRSLKVEIDDHTDGAGLHFYDHFNMVERMSTDSSMGMYTDRVRHIFAR